MNSRVHPSGNPSSAVGAGSARKAPKNQEAQRSRTTEAGEGTTGADLISDVTEAARSASRAVREQATEVGSELGHELGKSANVQKERGAEAVRAFARAIDTAAAELEPQSPAMARYAHETAQRFEALSTNIAGKEIPELMKVAAGLARAQPAWFLGGAVALGFGITRFLMATPAEAESTDSRTKGNRRQGSATRRESHAG
jgi:hypothetical protein